MIKNRTEDQISRNMAAIKCKDSKIERAFRSCLWSNGLRYRKNTRSIIGCPDISIKRIRVAVFIDSEFWHGYNWDKAKMDLKKNSDFWIKKIERNILRDNEVNKYLVANDWLVIRIWGKLIEKDANNCSMVVYKKIMERRASNKRKGEIIIYGQ